MQLNISEFEPFASKLKQERSERLERGRNLLSFGVQFLDEALGGITTDDLMIVASKTGRGKTQLVMNIALANVKLGKRVHFFALEAERFEIERRLKFQIIADRYFRLAEKPPVYFNYLDWYCGKLDPYLDKLENIADEELLSYKNLFVYYRQADFTYKDFQRLTLAVKEETDLIIVDHLHYFDFDDDNENRALKDTIKTIRDTALFSAKPVVLVSHVRKSNRQIKQLVPDIEDLHGSSDIGKVGTKIITLGPKNNTAEGNKTHKQTIFNIVKCRADGSRMDYVGLLDFNLSTQRYEKNYHLGRLNCTATEFEPFTREELPHWAHNALTDIDPCEKAKKAINGFKLTEI